VNGNEAFLWTPEAGMVGLGDLPGGIFWSHGHGINDFDQVVGVTATEYYGRGVHEAFLWDPEMGMFGLGHLPAGDFNTLAYDINNAAQVTGWSGGATRLLEAFIWDPVNKMRPLGDAPGIWPTIGYAINELGQVAGSAWTAAGRTEAFFWDPKMGIRVLGVLPVSGRSTSARGINDRGMVVGLAVSGDIFNRWQEGFIWDAENGLRSLNDLLEARTPAEQREIVGALEINNAGQIIADPHAAGRGDVLLTPFLLSDLNCDEQVDFDDLTALRLLLDYPAAYAFVYPDCPGESAGDVNQDALVDERDYWSLRGYLTRRPATRPPTANRR
jgi:probable HAF family extracellular repeat protein